MSMTRKFIIISTRYITCIAAFFHDKDVHYHMYKKQRIGLQLMCLTKKLFQDVQDTEQCIGTYVHNKEVYYN
jgi:hypothetical protein